MVESIFNHLTNLHISLLMMLLNLIISNFKTLILNFKFKLKIILINLHFILYFVFKEFVSIKFYFNHYLIMFLITFFLLIN